MPEQPGYSDEQLVEAREGVDKEVRAQKTQELQDILDNRGPIRRTVDRVTGRESRLRAEVESRNNAEQAAGAAEAQAELDYDTGLAKLVQAGERAGGDFVDLGRTTHEDQKAAVTILADTMHEHGYIYRGSETDLPDTSTGREREPHGEEKMRERGGFLIHAMDTRMEDSLSTIAYQASREDKDKDPDWQKSAERSAKELALTAALQKYYVEEMRRAVDKEAPYPERSTLLAILRGPDWKKEYDEAQEESYRGTYASGEAARAKMERMSKITPEEQQMIETARWSALAAIQSLTGAAPILDRRSEPGDTRRMDMDPRARSYPVEIQELFYQESTKQIEQIEPGTNVDVHLGLDLVVTVMIAQDANGRRLLQPGQVKSVLTEEQRETRERGDDYIRELSDSNDAYYTRTPSSETSAERQARAAQQEEAMRRYDV